MLSFLHWLQPKGCSTGIYLLVPGGLPAEETPGPNRRHDSPFMNSSSSCRGTGAMNSCVGYHDYLWQNPPYQHLSSHLLQEQQVHPDIAQQETVMAWHKQSLEIKWQLSMLLSCFMKMDSSLSHVACISKLNSASSTIIRIISAPTPPFATTWPQPGGQSQLRSAAPAWTIVAAVSTVCKLTHLNQWTNHLQAPCNIQITVIVGLCVVAPMCASQLSLRWWTTAALDPSRTWNELCFCPRLLHMGKSDFHSTGLTAQPSPLTGSLGICNPINLSQSAKYAAGATSNGFFCPLPLTAANWFQAIRQPWAKCGHMAGKIQW